MSIKTGRPTGFTLIEVMIVVAIVGIIAMIAYPSYQKHVQDSRRAQAQADLMELAQFMERRYTLNNTYENLTLPFDQTPKNGTAHYELELIDPERSSFTLQATPVGAQTSDRCGTMTIDQGNQRTAADDNCW
ncbi:type IV pilin protein [Aquisalimonas sp.]|uniref:type IV pilin protein n=1 Tax=Aquisalimonas sp. TaxID=1872621 RepID=UPI0025C23B7B|nr:type IV pilin protein [Aquisalimonas sp.]